MNVDNKRSSDRIIRVMYVAGSPRFRPVVARFLEQADEVRLVAVSSEMQNVLAVAQGAHPQVIVIDLDTPNRESLELVSQLHKTLPQASIVGLSLLQIAGYRQAVLKAGASDVVFKSNLSTELLPAIRRVASLGRPPHVASQPNLTHNWPRA